jgi:hypothetical protein
MPQTNDVASDRLGGGVVRDIEVRPSMRRRARFSTWGARGPIGRLAALAVVSAVLLLPQTSSARPTLIDTTPPVVTYTIDGIVGTNAWYQGNTRGNFVVVQWHVSDPESPITDTRNCEPGDRVPGPTGGTTHTCSATSDGGTTTVTTRVIKIDATAPAVAPRASRSPDSNGWYNHAVPVAFSGTDGMSGVASCSAATYAGPDNSHAVVHGTCTDRAGNSGSGSLPLAYDATPPQLKKLRVKNGDHAAIFKWQVSPDTQRVVISRTPGKQRGASSTVYGGTAKSFRDKGLRVGTHYRYTVSAYDVAGNKAARTVSVTGTGALFAPAPGARVAGAPRLTWAAVRGASYYNVQLVRGGRIFSAWPSGTSMRLPRSWVYHGHRYSLHRGVYRWFVWPGFGRQAASRYGRLVGKSSFFYAG